MKRAVLIGVLALLAGPPAGSAELLRLAARETRALPFPGAVAVFAVDPSTVEASQANGEVVLLGRRAGRTLVTVVLPERVETLSVMVDPPPPLLPTSSASREGPGGSFDIRHDTLTGRSAASLAANFANGERATRLRLEGLREAHAAEGERSFALPWASLAFESPGRSLVLLDDLVRQSPLTIAGAVLRGAHLRTGGLQVYGGVQADRPFGNLLLPGSGDRALGLTWNPPGPGFRLVPRVLWLPDSPTRVPGVLAMGIEKGGPEDALQVRGELGWSGSPGASFDVNFRNARRQAWLQASHRPADFAALRLSHPAGDEAEGAWTERLGEHTTATVTASASRLALAGGHPAAASARAELRRQLSPAWSVSMAAGGGRYRGLEGDRVSRRTLSMGAAYEQTDFGASALVRHQQSSLGDGGFGMRLSSRLANGGWRGNAFIDAQRQAPTVPLMLQDRPDLARAVAELGLTSNDPEEVLRLLRDNAALLATRGVSLGALELDPLRLQAGLDLSWRGHSGSPEIGVRLLADNAPGLAGSRRQTIATLYASWRVTSQSEFGLSYSRTSWQRAGGAGHGDSSLQVSWRTTFSALPVPGAGSRAISGVVLREDASAGTAATPAAGVEVVLDRSRRTVTDAEGRFSFERPGAGGHRLEAVLPAAPGVYFTTPSVLTLEPGGQGRFGLTFSAAVLTGVLRSDAGLPIAGATVRLQGSRQASTTTDSSGAYRFAAPDGEAQVSVDPASLAPGYELGDLAPQGTRLARGKPATVDFVVRAQRTLQGVVPVVGGELPVIELPQLRREVKPDAAGRFMLRGLPAGPLTLIVKTSRGSHRQVVEVPATPGSTAGVQLLLP